MQLGLKAFTPCEKLHFITLLLLRSNNEMFKLLLDRSKKNNKSNSRLEIFQPFAEKSKLEKEEMLNGTFVNA